MDDAQTRSGAEFSPYTIGPPIQAPEHFVLEEAVQAALDRMDEDAPDMDQPELAPAGEVLQDVGSLDLFKDLDVLPSGQVEQAKNISQAKLQAKKHSHARRRARRATEAKQGAGPYSLQVKKVALARLREAEAVHAGVDVERAMAKDNKGVRKVSSPLETEMSLLNDAPVASSGFVSPRYHQTPEDRLPVDAHELGNREGWQYVPWDGK